MSPKKISRESVDVLFEMPDRLTGKTEKRDLNEEIVENVFREQRAKFQEQFGPLSLGDVEIGKAATIQVQDFHPVVTSIFVRLPIEVMETPQDAVRRVRAIVEEELTDAVGDVINDGLSKFYESARRRR